VLVDPPLSTAADVRLLGVRLLGLIVVGVGMTILTRRLALEYRAAQAAHMEASRLEAETNRFAELDRLRADFIASVSHDLRTPLSASRAALILLESSAHAWYEAHEQALLDNARRNIERLDLLIADLLTYNQLEAGTLQLERAFQDLRTVVQRALAVLEPLIHQEGQLLDVDLPVPLPITGDGRRLEQVVVNLLANAHMHTPAGTRIAIRGEAMDRAVKLVVRDNRPGVPTEEHEAIFRRSYRAKSGPETDGSGLGLAIARAIIELHGGRIWAESPPDKGTAIVITLPGPDAEHRR